MTVETQKHGNQIQHVMSTRLTHLLYTHVKEEAGRFKRGPICPHCEYFLSSAWYFKKEIIKRGSSV